MKRRPAIWLGAGILASILVVLLALLVARPPAAASAVPARVAPR